MLICKIISADSTEDGLVVSYQNCLDDSLVNEGKKLYSMTDTDDIETLAKRIQNDLTNDLQLLFKNMEVSKRNKEIMETLKQKLVDIKIELDSTVLSIKVG